MVQMGDQQRVRETRTYLQVATAQQFSDAVERITGRKVRAFASASDPDHNTVFEIFDLEPVQPST
jgi:hypothetical protein